MPLKNKLWYDRIPSCVLENPDLAEVCGFLKLPEHHATDVPIVGQSTEFEGE